MSFKNKEMRPILKKILRQFLSRQNFQGKFPNYRRIESDMLHLLSVEFDKYGGAFFLELAICPAKNLQTSWGKSISVDELTAAHMPPEDRVRLQATADHHSLPEDWFRFDSLSDESELWQLAEQIIDLFPQVNDWFRNKKAGANIYSVKTK